MAEHKNSERPPFDDAALARMWELVLEAILKFNSEAAAKQGKK